MKSLSSMTPELAYMHGKAAAQRLDVAYVPQVIRRDLCLLACYRAGMDSVSVVANLSGAA